MTCATAIDPELGRSLGQFERIDLEQLDAAQLHDRVESKVILRQQDVARCIERLAGEYRVFELDGRLSQSYCTEYFDTALLRSYHEHHNQKRRRVKIRYRTYVNSDVTFFELKQNVDGRTVKARRPSVRPTRNRLDAEDALFLYNQVGLSGEELFPSLAVDYQRILLARNDSTERVTIDLGVRFRCDDRIVCAQDLAVCEFKQASFNRESPAIAAMRRRPQMFSKYCMGLASCNPSLRRNRFKKVFRQLDSLGISADHSLETTPCTHIS